MCLSIRFCKFWVRFGIGFRLRLVLVKWLNFLFRLLLVSMLFLCLIRLLWLMNGNVVFLFI